VDSVLSDIAAPANGLYQVWFGYKKWICLLYLKPFIKFGKSTYKMSPY
jgi:hypothetical protein